MNMEQLLWRTRETNRDIKILTDTPRIPIYAVLEQSWASNDSWHYELLTCYMAEQEIRMTESNFLLHYWFLLLMTLPPNYYIKAESLNDSYTWMMEISDSWPVSDPQKFLLSFQGGKPKRLELSHCCKITQRWCFPKLLIWSSKKIFQGKKEHHSRFLPVFPSLLRF